jgi:hypothetical protein
MGSWAETKATYRFITNPRVTAERILDQHTGVRPVEEFGKKASRAQRPIEEKESFKWLLSVKTVEAIQQFSS